MKTARKLFAILFLTLYAFFAGNAVFNGAGNVVGATAAAFPSAEGMAYYAGEAAAAALPQRLGLLDGHARLMRGLGKTESGGLDVIAAEGGAFVDGAAQSWSNYQIAQFAAGLYRLQAQLDAAGQETRVTYISAQSQIINGYTAPLNAFPLPDQYLLMESMLYYMRAYSVDFLDTEFVLQRSGLPASAYIYKTDTKWTTQASFATAQALIGKLNAQYHAGIDPGWDYFNTDHFSFTTHADCYMGHMGERAGAPFTGTEPFVAILPDYETDFTYDAIGAAGALHLTGPFEETLFNEKHLTPEDLYRDNAYAAYMDGGAYYQRVIQNHGQPEGIKVLLIHDGSALPFAAFLALGFGETHMYWPGLAPDAASFRVAEYVAEHDIEYAFFLAECNYYALSSIFGVLDIE